MDHDCKLCASKERACQKCGHQMSWGRTMKRKDGTEATKLRCPKCRHEMVDFKIPYTALETDETAEAS